MKPEDRSTPMSRHERLASLQQCPRCGEKRLRVDTTYDLAARGDAQPDEKALCLNCGYQTGY